MSKRRGKGEWQQLIDEQAASGLSQKAFCGQKGIPLATFGYWKLKLRAEVASTVSLDDWIELPNGTSEPRGFWQIELDLGHGLCLRLRQG